MKAYFDYVVGSPYLFDEFPPSPTYGIASMKAGVVRVTQLHDFYCPIHGLQIFDDPKIVVFVTSNVWIHRERIVYPIGRFESPCGCCMTKLKLSSDNWLPKEIVMCQGTLN